MKKRLMVLVVALAAVCALALASCGSSSEYEGKWKATEASYMGITMNADDIYSTGFFVELKSGGKCVVTVDGEEGAGTWKEVNNGKGFCIDDDASMTFEKVETGKVKLNYGGIEITFVKQ